MICKICHGRVKALESLDIEVLRVAEELVRLKNLEGLHWLMISRSAAHGHEWSNLIYRAWVLQQVAEGVDCIPLRYKFDEFAKKHGISLGDQKLVLRALPRAKDLGDLKLALRGSRGRNEKKV